MKRCVSKPYLLELKTIAIELREILEKSLKTFFYIFIRKMMFNIL